MNLSPKLESYRADAFAGSGGKLTGQKPALKMKEVWSIRARLELRKRVRDLALFNLTIDSKLRGCDLVRRNVDDVAAGGKVTTRSIIVQKKTGHPVQPEITEQTRTGSRRGYADAIFWRATICFQAVLRHRLRYRLANTLGLFAGGSARSV